MSFTEDSSESEWKDTKMQQNKVIKQEHSSSHGKPKYSQKFCEKWLSIFEPWLTRCDDDPNKPFCRACQCRLDCNRCHLQRHERTTKHARNLEVLISKGESAARQNLSIRQERSKYYQQRKKNNSSLASSHDASELGMDTADDYIEEYMANGRATGKTDSETPFQFVQTEAPSGEQYTEETVLKQENVSTDGHGDPLPMRSASKNHHANIRVLPKKGIKKERMKLYMQIQKDKNELMDSFKDLMGGSFQASPPKEKNHVDLFFESVSSSVKALSPKLIAETKMRVSQLICELELRALTENDAVNASTGSATAAVKSAAPTALVMSSETGTVGNAAFIINQPVATVVHTTAHHAPPAEGGGQQFETLS